MVGIGANPNGAACRDTTFQYSWAAFLVFVLSQTKVASLTTENEIPQTVVCDLADFDVSPALKTTSASISKRNEHLDAYLTSVVNCRVSRRALCFLMMLMISSRPTAS